MNGLCVVQLNDMSLKRIAPSFIDENSLDSSENSFASNDLDEHSDSIDQPQKRKRQRLTHLTNSQKIQRRKEKNRAAAQAARDRKKEKMEDMESMLHELKQKNEQLKKENALLKKNSQILIDENRKLLKFKSDVESQSASSVENNKLPVKIDQMNNNLIVCNANSMKQISGADESAVFTKNASQQKKQLHEMFSRMIYMLILQTLGLLKQELNQSTPVAYKVIKLKSTLSKLYKMANARKMLQKPSDSIRIMNTYRKHSSRMTPLNAAMIVSFLVKAFGMKKTHH